jgi:cobalamin synthase
MSAGEVAQQTATVDEKTVEVALSLFEHIEGQINRTDNKAQVVLAADAIMLGWFSTQNPSLLQALLDGHASAVGRATSLLIALVFVGLFLSLAFGLLVILPRAGKSAGLSLVYFGDIARRGEREFITAYLRQSDVEVMESVLAGVHANARIARQKFRWVSLSVTFLLGTLVVVAAIGVIRLALP